MRRKKTKKINFFLISILLLTVVSVGYAYLSSNLNITGQITGDFSGEGYVIDRQSNPNLSISKPVINKWESNGQHYYQYQFNVTNIGNIDVDNFVAVFTFSSNIKNIDIWEYNYELNNKTVTVINNQKYLKPNESATVAFILQTDKSNFKLMRVKLAIEESTTEIEPSKFEIVFTPVGSWGKYVYQYDVKITNKTGFQVNHWQIDIELPSNTFYIGGWNGVFKVQNNVLTIEHTASNSRIENNQSITIGLQIETNIINFIPTVNKINIRR